MFAVQGMFKGNLFYYKLEQDVFIEEMRDQKRYRKRGRYVVNIFP